MKSGEKCGQCGGWMTFGGSKKLGLCNKCYIRHRRGDPKPCLRCGKVAKVRRVRDPIGANCEVLEYAERYVEDQSSRFSGPTLDPVMTRLREFWWFLVNSYGDRPKSIWEAFYPIDDLLGSDQIHLEDTWDTLEAFRRTSRVKHVRYKAAVHVYMEFLASTGLIPARREQLWRLADKRFVEDALPSYRKPFGEYLRFCRETRQLGNWTTYLIGYYLREFLDWLACECNGSPFSAVHAGHMKAFLAFQREHVGAKTVYNTWRILDDFFKWAKMQRLVFVNPASPTRVHAPDLLPEGLPASVQRRLLRRWMDADCDPVEAAMGMLSLFYGLSTKEICAMEVDHLDREEGLLAIGTRPTPLPLCTEVDEVLVRYMAHREKLLRGAPCRYIFVSRISLRQNRKMNPLTAVSHLRQAKVNLRSLRATCLIDVALSGNIKVLEALGLTADGTGRYVRVVQDMLAARGFGEVDW